MTLKITRTILILLLRNNTERASRLADKTLSKVQKKIGFTTKGKIKIIYKLAFKAEHINVPLNFFAKTALDPIN